MRVSHPIHVRLPDSGVLFAESAHGPDFHMPSRADSYHKLIYLLTGRVTYSEKGRRPAEAVAGTVLLVPRGVVHELADQANSLLFLLCFAGSFRGLDPDLPRLWQGLGQRTDRQVALARPTRHQLESMWRRGLAEQAQPRAGGAAVVRALAAQTLVLLARLPSGQVGSAADRVAAVKREIEETFYEPWDVDRAAARAALSRRRFTDLFRALSRSTFWEFLTELRLAHAAKLLRGREHTVTGVMFSCGFNDLSHFYRMFRQRHGAAPGAWLRKLPRWRG